MISIESCVRRGTGRLRRLWVDPRIHLVLQGAFYMAAGFLLSAASLLQHALPLAMGFIWACSGWAGVLAALGGALGYLTFWGSAGYQGILWCLGGLGGALLLGDRKTEMPFLAPAAAALTVAASGVAFQAFGAETASVPVFLLRVLLGTAAVWLFTQVMRGRNPVLDWFAWGFGVLALAQVAPLPWLSLGFLAAGGLTGAGPFPAAALAGLALDLAQVTAVPMTAVAVLGFLPRLLPRGSVWLCRIFPGLMYIAVMLLGGVWDLSPLPGLLLGGILGSLVPGPAPAVHRRGEVGVAQVRLELAAGVLSQTRGLLTEVPEIPVDADALVVRAADRACSSCPCRRNCRDCSRISQLPGLILHKPLLSAQELPVVCRKNGRFLAELHRAQEQLRSIRADRERQKEYRAAVIQQYRFLEDFLQELSDRLIRRADRTEPCFAPEVSVYGNRPEGENGDQCQWFAGTVCRYYIILCDGMGTGLEAAREARDAGGLLKRLLTAGYPAEYALRSLNSLCALRERAGVTTVDMAEVDLSTGKGTLYKWGAVPSYLVSGIGAEKIGTAGPPPGISVSEAREQMEHFSLRRNRMLVMVSDGIPEEAALRCCLSHGGGTPGELARSLLTCDPQNDDATVVTVRLRLQ